MKAKTSPARLLWIDARRPSEGPGLVAAVPPGWAVASVGDGDAIPEAVRSCRPNVACVEFSYPDGAHLQVVPFLRRAFPSLPLLVFTEYHSEALAVWAFRCGVWDYRVKPVDPEILARSIAFAASFPAHGHPPHHDATPMPAALLEPGAHLRSPLVTTRRTGTAIAYIAGHYAEAIRQNKMASLCHLSSSEFSRVFRREHGCTFERFVVDYRITKARELLDTSRLTITQIAHAVGFNDSSYFTRAFRRSAGLPPSRYRVQVHAR